MVPRLRSPVNVELYPEGAKVTQWCPACGSVAYVGLKEVECSNPECRLFHLLEGTSWVYYGEDDEYTAGAD